MSQHIYLPDHSGSIGVFDSGIGGLSVANAVSGLLPTERMLYVADNAHAPYGGRTDAEVREYSRCITDFLLRAGVKLIVVACNTATSVSIDYLRDAYPDVPFVGLEPAVKPAAESTNVAVMATAVTLRSDRYRALRDRYLADRPVWENACTGLVELIEEYPSGSPQISDYLTELFKTSGNPDAVVLGCTHYPLIAADIAAVVGPDVKVIDPSGAAARQVQRILEKQGLLTSETTAGRYDFFCTGSSTALQRTLGRLTELNGYRRWVVPYLTLK
ncbi:glutamate racemase [Lewinella aquimaris]|uniref:Glutamate racemase n=1 Tax=Neolewinella aquimaris TaxID=1835722 RepID=A0A840EAU3_9BACT|nr:glutamate racemase [Neolewinella aquimaris]MBB4081053.1 glutamate racemase [Neolewinella aquimaris]